MKIFETNEEIVDMVNEAFDNANLSNYGLGLKVLSVTKAKDVLKISKASVTTNFLTNQKVDLTLFVYEEAFERLDEAAKRMLIEMVLSNVSFDIDKEKIVVETNPFAQVFAMRTKYGDAFMNALELSYIVIKQIEEEQAEKKQAEKEAKAAKKNK